MKCQILFSPRKTSRRLRLRWEKSDSVDSSLSWSCEKKKKKAAYFFISLLCWEKKKKKKSWHVLPQFGAVATPCQRSEMVLRSWIATLEASQRKVWNCVATATILSTGHYIVHRLFSSSADFLPPRLLYQTPFRASALEHLLNAECQGSLSSLRPQLTGHVEVLNGGQDCPCSAGPECVYERHDRHSKMREWAVIQGAAPPSGIIFPPTGNLEKSGGESVCV